jgi:hypothetical protein
MQHCFRHPSPLHQQQESIDLLQLGGGRMNEHDSRVQVSARKEVRVHGACLSGGLGTRTYGVCLHSKTVCWQAAVMILIGHFFAMWERAQRGFQR